MSLLRPGAIGLSLRSLLWAVLLPGLFAGYVPWRYFGLRDAHFDQGDPVFWTGFIVLLAGVVLLGACIWEFARRGRGTLSPVDPPRDLVVEGLYRYVRNPMYLSVTLIVFGEFLLGARPGLVVYWIIWFVWINIFVRFHEEPTLRRQFGAAYEEYTRAVPRWLPRLHPYQPSVPPVRR